MIDSVYIQHFQAHEETLVKFSPGVNAIRGTSRSGKTAILRAVRWVVQNYPRGDSFIRFGEKKTKAVLKTVEGNKIERVRTPSTNYYELDGERLEAMRTSVPVEVEEVLRLGDINWQFEHDSPYLLNETAGQVAKKLNEVADLAKIDLSLSNLSSWLRNTNSRLGTVQEELDSEQRKLKEYQYLPEMEKDLVELEALKEDIDDSQETVDKLDVLTDDAERLEPLVKRAEFVASGASGLEDMEILQDDILDIEDQVSDLKEIVSLVQSLSDKKKRAEDEYKELNNEFQTTFPDVCPLCGSKVEGKAK